MNLEEIKKILDSAFVDKDVEIGCDDCENKMDEYATYALGEKEFDQPLYAIKDHLELCKFCNEEFQSLLQALKFTQ